MLALATKTRESEATAAPRSAPVYADTLVHTAAQPFTGERKPTSERRTSTPLYTPEQRKRRDETPWTLVQGVLAPVQFLAFAISTALVMRTLITGEGETAAAVSVVVKTALLAAIMVTGAIWEKRVFGVYLFARPFFWEDAFSMIVIALHAAYVAALGADLLGLLPSSAELQLTIALAAYAAYAVNATQFVLKLRAARLESTTEDRRAASAPEAG